MLGWPLGLCCAVLCAVLGSTAGCAVDAACRGSAVAQAAALPESNSRYLMNNGVIKVVHRE